jgi:dTDP-4-dehydrorhamnose 3,5-epimerase
MMQVLQGTLDGIRIIEPEIHADGRGIFFEMWNGQQFANAGLDLRFVQDNIVVSRKNVLRGLHFQNPNPQGKLITVLQGEVFDVFVDIRKHSPTFGRWGAATLTSSQRTILYVPPGFAHGYVVRSTEATVLYKCTEFYDPSSEMVLLWNDPELGIEWNSADPVVSAKDSKGMRLMEIPEGRLF